MLLFNLSWAIKQLIFAYWLYVLIKHCFFCFLLCFFVVANSGYFTVFTSHIYFIILISTIAGNLVEIRLPKIQSRKCLRKFNFNEIRSPELSAYNLPQPKEFFPSTMFEIFSSILAYRFFDLFVGCGLFSLCNLFLSVSRATPLTLKNKLAIFMFELLH